MHWTTIALLMAAGGVSACSVLSMTPQPSMASGRWVAVDSGSEASLRGLCVVDEEVVWASGSSGTVLRSLDGGRRWSQLAVPGAEAMDFRDVHAFDGSTAFVMGITEPACVMRTEDGGMSWETVFLSDIQTDFFDSLTFFDRERACLFGDPQGGVFTVLCSDDGGASWQRVEADKLPVARPEEAAFAASGTCIASQPNGQAWIATGGGHARVLRSTDFGQSWAAIETPIIAGGTSGIYSVAFRDSQNGLISGGDYSKPEVAENNLAWSDDGGLNWTLVPAENLVSGYRSAVAHVPMRKDTWVAMGRAGSDYSVDGGRSWNPLGSEGYYALGFTPKGVGIAVGADGRIARLEFGVAP